jgi:hypothetical protein
MELTERELLIKIEQQLNNLSASHKEVLTEISTLFEKQDRESKLLAVLNSEFKNHIESVKFQREETSKQCVLNRDDMDKRISKNERHIEKLFSEIESDRLIAVAAKSKVESLPGKIQSSEDSLKAYIDGALNEEAAEREVTINEEIAERKNFETKITAYVKSSKVFVSLLAFLITLLTSLLFPALIALFKNWLQ